MEVISRQRILSKSKDDLTYSNEYQDEDQWYDVDQLVKEHIHEILKKWEQIDDGIWAKAIVFEKNRRVAKAYVRPPILTVNGLDVGFDGHRIGLRGFDNPMRDAKTSEIISRNVGQGVKIRMDNNGNIEVKKLSTSNIFIKPLGDDTALSDELLKSPNYALDQGKQTVFDIKKFEQNIDREIKKTYPNRAKLESQCILAITFAKCSNILQCPSWVILINIVAMDMLRSKLPLGVYAKVPNIRNRPRLPVPEEDPYSMTGGSSSGGSSGKEKSSRDKPPKLPPPRDSGSSNKSSSKGDYDSPDESLFRRFRIPMPKMSKDKDKKYDDPYYCGLRARVPDYKSKNKDKKDQSRGQYPPPTQSQIPPHAMFHSRSVDSGMAQMPYNNTLQNNKLERNPCSWVTPVPKGYDSDFTESPYAQIYGRLPMPNRGYLNHPQMYPYGMYGNWN